MWGPQDSVQLVNITPRTMIYGTQINIVFMGWIKTNVHITGGAHIVPCLHGRKSEWKTRWTFHGWSWLIIQLKLIKIAHDGPNHGTIWLVSKINFIWFYFPFHIWGVIPPIDELHDFSGGAGIPPSSHSRSNFSHIFSRPSFVDLPAWGTLGTTPLLRPSAGSFKKGVRFNWRKVTWVSFYEP